MILGVSETFYIRDLDVQPLLDGAEAVESRVVNDVSGQFINTEFIRDLFAVEKGYGIAVESQVSWEGGRRGISIWSQPWNLFR